MSNERFIVTKTDEIYGTPVISEDDTNLRIVTSSATTSAPEFVVTKTDEIYGTPVITEDDTNLRIVTSSATTSAPEFVATKTDGIDGSPAITEDDTNLLIVTSSATASAPQFVAQKNSSYVGPSTDLKSASVDLQYASFYSHTESFISTSEIDHKPSIPKLQKQQFEGELENPCCALFEEEIDERPRVATVLNTITNYSMMSQNVTKQDSEVRKVETVPSAKLGTIMGVYLPCVQNILGVILFVRMTWIVGLAGIIEGFFIVFLCVCTTLNTSISMSAIATNGVVPAGGAYFMISRALGPEFGGAVGLLFYLGTTYASSLYILGAVEILLTYMAPELSLFGDFRGPENRGALFNNYRVYGSIFLVLMTVLVFVGVKLVNKFASLFLACVIISIISIWGGIIKSAFSPPDISICFLGNRLLRQLQGDKICAKFAFNSTTNTTERTSLYRQHCSLQNDAWICDPFFEANDLKEDLAVPGLGHVMDNVYSTYLEKEAPISTAMFSSVEASSNYASPPWVVADLTSSFTVLLAIFFPSVTGIMAGSNRSGDLADGQRSIPRGTIGAVLTTGCIYLCSVVLFGLCIHGAVLRDKFGESIGDELIVSIVSWPNKWVVLVGAFLSTIGAGLQSLTGAPRLLQAIAKDNIIPILQVFGSGKQNGEPTWALLLTFFISCSGILIANLDLVAPILTMFFLMCYMFVNLACALHSLLDTPNWRPRYNYYHWFLSLIGVCLCITLMFISSWYYALAALAVAGIIYKYIEYSGAEKEWGDGLRGLKLTTARFALLRVGSGQPHTKNWRPQLLVLLKLDARLAPKNPGVLAFVAQLKAGKGLIVVASVLEGDSCEKYLDAKTAEQNLAKEMDFYKIKGFEQVLVSRSIEDGVSALIQTAGLGGLSPNTIVLGWPYDKHFKGGRRSYSAFLRAVRQASTQQKAILVPKYIEKFPIRPDQIMTSTIDVWWIVHDGGLLMLLPFLLTQHKTWKSCIIRIFTVAQLEDNSVQIKKDLELFLYQLRIEAKVSVIEMQDSDISAYTYERTLRMEQRTEILNKLHMSKRDSQKDVADVIERSRHNYFLNKVHPIEKSPLDEYSEEETETRDEKPVEVTQRTWTKQKNALICIKESGTESLSDSVEPDPFRLKPRKTNVRRMHTAIRLNEAILQKSRKASLVILNLPGPPKGITPAREANYMEYIEVLTEGIDRVLMVRGGGREVITIYS